MKLYLLFGLFCCLFICDVLGTPPKCGLCRDNPPKSPENACPEHYQCKKSCGLFGWGRCTRTCTRYKCCKGRLVGNQCHISGCGGCSDNTVLDQPACYRTSSKLEKFSFKVGCGFLGLGRCTRYALRYVTVKTPYCCSGFKVLLGNRCCKTVVPLSPGMKLALPREIVTPSTPHPLSVDRIEREK